MPKAPPRRLVWDTVALDHEGSVALVGSPLAEEDLGAAFAFGEANPSWLPSRLEFRAHNETPWDYFGDSIRLDGAGSTVLIGRYDPGAYFFGIPPAHFAEPPASKEPPVGKKPPVNTKPLESTTGTTQTTTTGAEQTSAALAPGDVAISLGGAPVAVVTRIGNVTLSPTTFPSAPQGTSAFAASSRYGATLTYTLNTTGKVRFTVVEAQRGRNTLAGHCVEPTKANRGAGNCTRLVTLPGSFAQTGKAGGNQFHFTGRLDGRKLAVGSYHLIAIPMTGDNSGLAATASFRVIK